MLPGAGRVQVDEGGAAGGVAHAFHQLTRVGARFGDELVPGMAQVVEVDVGRPVAASAGSQIRRRKLACRSGMPCGLVNTSASASGRVKVSRCELTSATIRAGIETVRLPASDLGGAEERRTSGHLAELPGDADGPVVAVDVGALESGQLAPPQAAEAGEQDQRPVSRADRIGQGVDLADGQDWPLW